MPITARAEHLIVIKADGTRDFVERQQSLLAPGVNRPSAQTQNLSNLSLSL